MATRSGSRSRRRNRQEKQKKQACMVAMCKDVVVGSTANRQMYIDMGWQLRERGRAGRDGGMPDEAGLSATNYTCTQSNQQAGYEPNE